MIVRLVPLVCALAALLTAIPASARAQPGAIGPDRIPQSLFLSEINRLIDELESATSADAPRIAATVPQRWRVVVGEQDVDVSATWLRSALVDAPNRPSGWPTTRQSIRRRLQNVRDHAAAQINMDASGARSRARSSVQGILDRSEFQQSAASRWREDMQERIGRWLEDLWARLGGGRSAGRTTALVFAWAAGIAALVGLGFWLARTLANQPRGGPLDLGAGPGARARARDLALKALLEARSGDVRAAVRSAYHAALIRLEEEGVWRVDEARTPREYLPMLRTSDRRHAPLLELTRRFEHVWYGNRATAADDTERLSAHLETLGCLRPGERAI